MMTSNPPHSASEPRLALLRRRLARWPHPLIAQRAERATLDITGYIIDAELDTATHHIAAKAQVSPSPRPKAPKRSASAFIPLSRSPRSPTTAASCSPANASPTAPFASRPATPFVTGQANALDLRLRRHRSPATKMAPSKASNSPPSRSPSPTCSTPRAGSPPPATSPIASPRRLHIKVPQGMEVFASGAQGTSHPVDPRQRQTRRPIRLQLGQARIPGHRHRRTLCGPVHRRPRQRQGLSHRQPPGLGQSGR